MKSNLRHNLLIYVAYCLKSKFFSYEKCQKDLVSIGIKSTIPTLRKEFSLAKKEGLIEFKTYYHKLYPILSTKGKLAIKTHLPFRRWGDFDGSWKMVIFDIPDDLRSKRVQFQNELITLGFGKISRGVYLSPNPLFSKVKRLTHKLRISKHITCIKTASFEDEKKKIARAWNLEEVDNQYKEYTEKVRQQLELNQKNPLWPFFAKDLEKEFAQIYQNDPHLPEQFLTANWQGQTAYGIFKAISNSY